MMSECRKEELERGYWGDANELLTNREGKFFHAPTKLTSKQEASKLLHDIPSTLPIYKPFDFTKVNLEEVRFMIISCMIPLAMLMKVHLSNVQEMSKKAPTLVLVTCKHMFTTAMLDSWRKPFQAEFPNLNCYEVSCLIIDRSSAESDDG